MMRGESYNEGSMSYAVDFYFREAWRFVLVQQAVVELAKTAIDYPPMQASASFNLSSVKKKIAETLKHREGQ
jgi:arylsulfatase